MKDTTTEKEFAMTRSRFAANTARKLGVVSTGVALAAVVSLSAPTSASAATCVDKIDIGITVKEGDHAKGSGSYTSCGTIRKVKLSIFMNGQRQNTQTRYMSSGSGAFSVVEYCGDYQPYGTWHTLIEAYNGQGTLWASKTSNYARFRC